MKKYLIVLIVFLSSILFINNVGASGYPITENTSSVGRFFYSEMLNLRSMTLENSIAIINEQCPDNSYTALAYEKAYNKAQELKSNFDNYIILPLWENSSAKTYCPYYYNVLFYNNGDMAYNDNVFYWSQLYRSQSSSTKNYYSNFGLFFKNNVSLNNYTCWGVRDNCSNYSESNYITNMTDNNNLNIKFNSYNVNDSVTIQKFGNYFFSVYNNQYIDKKKFLFDIPLDSKVIFGTIPWVWNKLNALESDVQYYSKINYNDEEIEPGYTMWEAEKPSIDYDVRLNEKEFMNSNGQNKIWDIVLKYNKMNDDYYSIYYNLKDGTKTKIDFDGNFEEYTIKNVKDDAIITAYIYDLKDNMIAYTTIDMSNDNFDKTKPYIYITGYNQNNIPNSVAYKYVNTNDTDYRCYYKFGGGELTQESCSTDEIKMRYALYNTSLSIMIYQNSDNKLIHTKSLNLNFIDNFPKISFESYYNSMSKAQILNITLIDYDINDIFYYSVNNTNWTTLPTQTNNTLSFSENTIVYFKVLRNEEPIADSLYNVILGNYSISISENMTLDEIKEMTGSSTNYIKSFFKSIKKILEEISKIIQELYNNLNYETKSFLVASFSLIIICSIILLARGKK